MITLRTTTPMWSYLVDDNEFRQWYTLDVLGHHGDKITMIKINQFVQNIKCGRDLMVEFHSLYC